MTNSVPRVSASSIHLPHVSPATTLSQDVEDRELVWADNGEMMQKTKEYEQRAMEAIRRGVMVQHAGNPWNNYHKGNSRLRVFGLDATRSNVTSPILDGPRELFQYLRDPTDADDRSTKPRRRVVVLEGMEPRVIETLGVLLDIPPEFFLAHCNHYIDLRVVDRTGAKLGTSTYWKVPVPQRRSVPAGFWGHHQLTSGDSYRGDVMLRGNTTSVDFYSPVSYWGRTSGTGSWTAVVVVDQHPITLLNTQSMGRIVLENYVPVKKVFYQVVDSPNDQTPQPHERPMFDAIVEAYESKAVGATDDPFSATVCVQNFVRSAWEDQIKQDESVVVEEVIFDENMYNSEESQASTKQDSVILAYRNLMMQRRGVNGRLKLLRTIIWELRHRVAAQEAYGLEDLTRTQIELWRYLEQMLEDTEMQLANHLEMYSQRAIMQESFEAHRQTAASNRLARSSGQLTKIATVVVPCTIVASVFSMNGEFAAGESLFFVYWAVSIPVTLCLLFWVIHSDVLEAWNKCIAWMDTDPFRRIVSSASSLTTPRPRPSDEEKVD